MAGALLAVAVAVGLSPLAPIGPVRPVYPDPGVAFDWTVLGSGSRSSSSCWARSAVGRGVPGLAAPRRAGPAVTSSAAPALARAAAACGLPPAAVTGIRSALGAGSGRDAAPVRSAVLGAVLAVVVVVTSITFGASLSFLVSRPALYGWNWNYALLAGFSAAEDLPAAETACPAQPRPGRGSLGRRVLRAA